MPILATAVQEELETGSASSGDAVSAASTVKMALTHHIEHTCYGLLTSEANCNVGHHCVWCPLQADKHHPALVKVLCSELGVEPEALLDFELCLADTQLGVSLSFRQLHINCL